MKELKELMAAMEKTDITRIRIKDKDKYEVELERAGSGHLHPSAPVYIPHPEFHSKFPVSATMPQRGHSHEEIAKEQAIDGKFIVAPLVGTVYLSPSPEDPSFVKVGDKIDENTVVCIIEAMKVMNEVKAGVSGTVAEILVSNGHPVEFGAKIIRVV